MVQGLDAFPEDERPTVRQVNTVHLAWDVMVGLGTLLFLLAVWYGAVVAVPARHPEDEVVPADRGGCGVLSVHRDGGRLGRHRGRAPTVDRARTT